MYETHISRMQENPLYKIVGSKVCDIIVSSCFDYPLYEIVGCKVCDVILSSCFDSIERKQGEWDFIKWMEFVVP